MGCCLPAGVGQAPARIASRAAGIPDSAAALTVNKALNKFDAKRIVIGHTPTATRRVTSRIDGHVISLDTGMLAAVYRGRPSALIIEGDKLSTIYVGDASTSKPEDEQARIADQNMSDQELENFLLTAEVTEIKRLAEGVTRPMRITLE